MDAYAITHAQNGKWHRHYGACACPVCQPEGRRDQNALTLRDSLDGRLLLNCKKTGCAFRDILSALSIAPGGYTAPDPHVMAQRNAEKNKQAAKRARQAEMCWREAVEIHGTPAETYLRGRGISCALPGTLRFHGACWHGPTSRRLPAMVAAVSSVDGPMSPAIHRTYLRPDGYGKADVENCKMMNGAVGGGGATLSDREGPLVVCEGIETGLSLLSGLLPHAGAVVAALSASGVQCLRLPPRSQKLILAPDGDDAGRAAADALANRAYTLGWTVEVVTPPQGQDFNEILMKKEAA